MSLLLYIDGGSRGNPGPAAAGVVLRDSDNRSLLEAGYLLDVMTNNQAEYCALLLGLQTANRHANDRVTIYSDSELLVKQIVGDYRVKSPTLKPLYKDVQRELFRFNSWEIHHIKRENNRRADQLLNQALDLDEDVVAVQTGEAYPRLTPKPSLSLHEFSPPESSAAAKSLRVLVEVEIGSAKQICGAPCEAGGQYVFDDAIPDELCIDAAYVMLGKVLQLKMKSSPAQEEQTPFRVKCSRPGCGAVFRVSILHNNVEKQPGNPE